MTSNSLSPDISENFLYLLSKYLKLLLDLMKENLVYPLANDLKQFVDLIKANFLYLFSNDLTQLIDLVKENLVVSHVACIPQHWRHHLLSTTENNIYKHVLGSITIYQNIFALFSSTYIYKYSHVAFAKQTDIKKLYQRNTIFCTVLSYSAVRVACVQYS